MGKIPNFTDSEQLKTPKTDCVLKVPQDKEIYQLVFQLESTWFSATLNFNHLRTDNCRVCVYIPMTDKSLHFNHHRTDKCKVSYIPLWQTKSLHFNCNTKVGPHKMGCGRGAGGMPPGNFEILHALKCVLGASEALYCACLQYIYTCKLLSLIRVSDQKVRCMGP